MILSKATAISLGVCILALFGRKADAYFITVRYIILSIINMKFKHGGTFEWGSVMSILGFYPPIKTPFYFSKGRCPC